MNSASQQSLVFGSEWPLAPGRQRVLLGAGNVDGYYSLPIRILSLVAAGSEQLAKSCDVRFSEWNIDDAVSVIASEVARWDPEILALSMNIWNRDQTLELATAIKRLSPKTVILVGGQEVSDSSIDYLEHGCIDFIIDGEGEIAFEQFLSAWVDGQIDAERVSGLWCRKDGASLRARPAENVTSLDDVPSPVLKGLVPIEKTKRLGVMIEGARGCPYRCSFCFEGLRNCRVRMGSPERIRDQIMAAAEMGARTIHMLDPILCSSNPKRLEKLTLDLRQAEERFGKKITVSVEAYAEHVTDDIADNLNDNYIIDVGLQSTHAPTLEAINRRFDRERFLQGVQRLKDRQLFFNLYLISALPYETMESWLQGLDTVVNLQPTTLFVNQLCLLNGTELRRRASEYGYVFDEKPPYTVRANRWLDRSDLTIIDRMGWDVSRRYNQSFRTLIIKDSPLALRESTPARERIGVGGHCRHRCPGCASERGETCVPSDLEPLADQFRGATVSLLCGTDASPMELRHLAGQLQFHKAARIRLKAPFAFYEGLCVEDVEKLVRSGIWFFHATLDVETFRTCDESELSVLKRLRREVSLPRRGSIRPYVELSLQVPDPLSESNLRVIGTFARYVDAMALPLCKANGNGDVRDAMVKAANGELRPSDVRPEDAVIDSGGELSCDRSSKQDHSFLLKVPRECILASFEEFNAPDKTMEIMEKLELLAEPPGEYSCHQPLTGLIQ